MVEQAKTPKVIVDDWGLISYGEAWKRQTVLHKGLIEQKRGRASGFSNRLILCEHQPVYTLGKSGSVDHLVWSEKEREERGVEYYKTNRGGDITYHGPGQLVAYPIFDLDQFFRDVHRYVRSIEECIIQVLSKYDIDASRIKDYTGVWIHGNPNRKICAIGVHLSRWVSMHGLALNVNTNLDHFQGIVPCGISDQDKKVTSMQAELNKAVSMDQVKQDLIDAFQNIFEFEISEYNDVKSKAGQ